jgi:hypothetical protein
LNRRCVSDGRGQGHQGVEEECESFCRGLAVAERGRLNNQVVAAFDGLIVEEVEGSKAQKGAEYYMGVGEV